jgi:hypothetical protein
LCNLFFLALFEEKLKLLDQLKHWPVIRHCNPVSGRKPVPYIKKGRIIRPTGYPVHPYQEFVAMQ